MKMMIAAALTAIMILVPGVPQAGAADALPDRVTGTLTLSGDHDLSAVLTVDSGATLILEPGCRLRTAADASIVVYGRLEVRGTADQTVVLSPAGEDRWQGIRFLQGSGGSIEHLEVSGAVTGISMIAATVTMGNSLVTGAEKGVHLVKEARADVRRCVLKGNVVAVVAEMKSAGSLTGSRLTDNEVGVGIGSGALVQVLDNRFERNRIGVRVFQRFPGRIAGNLFQDGLVGIRLEQNGPDTVIEKNRFANNREGAIQALSFTSPTIRNNMILGGKYGILANQFSSPTILNNRIEKTEQAIHLNKKGMAVIRDNLISRSETGIFLDFSSYPEVRNNRFEGNTTHVRLGRFQSSHWEAAAGSRQIVMETAARLNSRNPRLAQSRDQYPEAVDFTGNWWDEKTAAEMREKAAGGNVGAVYDGHDLPEVTYEGFGDEKYRVDKVIYLPLLDRQPETAGLSGWRGREDELGL